MNEKYPGAELILEKLKLLDSLLDTKLTEEQIEILIDWCKSDESFSLLNKEGEKRDRYVL